MPLVLASYALAQTTIGWDFSNYFQDGFTSTDGASITGSVNANYFNGAADFNGASSFGTLFYDGSFGTLNGAVATSEPINPRGSFDTIVGNQGYLGTSGSLAILNSQGQQFTNAKGLGITTDGSIAFDINLGGATDFTSLDYAGFNSTDSGTSLAWEYSTDNGSSFTSLETDTITTGPTEFSVDLSSITGASDVVLRANLTGLDEGGSFIIDNVTVGGTVVPEPSTYAAIAGLIALGFTAYYRRKK